MVSFLVQLPSNSPHETFLLEQKQRAEVKASVDDGLKTLKSSLLKTTIVVIPPPSCREDQYETCGHPSLQRALLDVELLETRLHSLCSIKQASLSGGIHLKSGQVLPLVKGDPLEGTAACPVLFLPLVMLDAPAFKASLSCFAVQKLRLERSEQQEPSDFEDVGELGEFDLQTFCLVRVRSFPASKASLFFVLYEPRRLVLFLL